MIQMLKLSVFNKVMICEVLADEIIWCSIVAVATTYDVSEAGHRIV